MTGGDHFTSAIQLLESGDVESLKNLLSAHPELATEIDEDNASLLIRLIDWPGNRPNSPAMAQALLDAGANADARRNDENGTPLSGALCTENVEVIRVLLAAGADIHTPCGWQEGTVLQQADQICEHYPRCGEEKIQQIATLIGAAAGREVPSRTPIGNPVPLLFVSDFPAALNFYQEKLGFRVDWTSGDDDDPYGSIVRGNTDLHITVCKCEGNVHVGRLWVRIHTPDVARLHAELVDKGVQMIKGPTTEPWDLREFKFNDPDGNRFVFFNFVD